MPRHYKRRTSRIYTPRGTSLLKRFMNRVHIPSERQNACWRWTGPLNQRGYGMFKLGGGGIHASRAAYLILVGPIGAGLYVCHRCDNPQCVRPSHLFLGTPQDNANDSVTKGRQRGWSRPVANTQGEHGEPYWRGRKISHEQRLDIIQRSQNESQRSIAKSLGVSHTAIYKILRNGN